MRRRDGEVILIPAGTSCVVLDVYKSPPGYEMEFDYGGEEFSIGIPADIVALFSLMIKPSFYS